MALALLARVQLIPSLAGANPAYLQNLIDAASNLIENYCKRVFLTTVYVDEVYDGDGSSVLLLRNIPITALTTVKVVRADDTEVACAGMEFRNDGSNRLSLQKGQRFCFALKEEVHAFDKRLVFRLLQHAPVFFIASDQVVNIL